MTEPIDVPMPKSYTAQISSPTSLSTMNITSGHSGVYIPLPVGVMTIQVIWDGARWVRPIFRPDGTPESNRYLTTIPAATLGTARSQLYQIAVDNPAAVLFVQSAAGVSDADVDRRAGVVIVPI